MSQEESRKIAFGMKIGVDFVSSIVVGVALGYFTDYMFLTAPFGMIVFILLGIAAAFLGLKRATKDFFLKGKGQAK
ncbi:MAG TPA: AtpZ/AtpI family protein [Alphaproteobacteria bacterium]|nr:AtpZ/AtpI family protein [Alphaproteobacteria bacterium]